MIEPKGILEYDRDYHLYRLRHFVGGISTQDDLREETRDMIYSTCFLCYVALAYFVYNIDSTPAPMMAMLDVMLAASILIFVLNSISYYETKKSMVYLLNKSYDLEIYKDIANYIFMFYVGYRFATLLVENNR